MLVLFVLVLCHAVCVMSAVPCSSVQPLTTLKIPQLRGAWDAVEVATLSGRQESGTSAPRCIRARVKNATSSELNVKLHVIGERSSVRRTKFSVNSEAPGRWSTFLSRASNASASHGEEVLVMAADPARYLVLVQCARTSHGLMVARRLCVLTRHASRSNMAAKRMSRRQLARMRTQIAARLGITQLRTTKLRTDCFKRSAKPNLTLPKCKSTCK